MTSSNDIQNELVRLREGNARLKGLLRKHGIAYDAKVASVVQTQKPMLQLSWMKRCRCFGVCFAGVRMCLNGDDESKDKKEEVKEALKGMSPEKIAVILSVIQK